LEILIIYLLFSEVKPYGQTKRDIKVIISMTKNMGRVFSSGEMVNNIRDNGKMENSMDKVKLELN
jgi:hypothetical protein